MISAAEPVPIEVRLEPNREVCPTCDGEGFFGDGHDLTLIEECPRCHGDGWAPDCGRSDR